VLGWIDMGHARGNDVAALKRQFIESIAASILFKSCIGKIYGRLKIPIAAWRNKVDWPHESPDSWYHLS
jgi:hypothetical protein